MRIASVGHAVFAAIFIALGILSLVQGQFAPVWQGVPKAWPARELLVCLCACVSLACGIGLFWPRSAAPAARLLFAYLLAWMLIFKIPFILRDPFVEVNYQSNGENAVLVAAAWALYCAFATDWDKRQIRFATGKRGIHYARVLYALALIAFGLSHFAYLNLTAPLVPGWLPWHVFWAYFTGCAYLAAALAILTGICARLAAVLVVLQMALFGLIIWVPMVAAGGISDFRFGEFVMNWVLTAGAWVMADSYRGLPWLAVARVRQRAPA